MHVPDQYLYEGQSYVQPLFTTYFKTSLFSIYLVAFIFWRPWQRQCGCNWKCRRKNHHHHHHHNHHNHHDHHDHHNHHHHHDHHTSRRHEDSYSNGHLSCDHDCQLENGGGKCPMMAKETSVSNLCSNSRNIRTSTCTHVYMYM